MRSEGVVDGQGDYSGGQGEHDTQHTFAHEHVRHLHRRDEQCLKRPALLLLDEAGGRHESPADPDGVQHQQRQQATDDGYCVALAHGRHGDLDRRRCSGHPPDQINRGYPQDDAIGRQALTTHEELKDRLVAGTQGGVEARLEDQPSIEVVRLHQRSQVVGGFRESDLDTLDVPHGLGDTRLSLIHDAEPRGRLEQVAEYAPDEHREHHRHDEGVEEQRGARPQPEVLA